MILSLLTLDLSSPGVRQSLRNAQDMHRTIMKAFNKSRQEEKVLFRTLRTEKDIQVYVQSKGIPNWDRIEQFGFYCVRTKDISKLPESFKQDQILHFKLLGCPSKKVSGDGKNSKRVLLRSEEAQINWLCRQGEKYGFRILETHIAGSAETVSGTKASGNFSVTGIPFEGVFQISATDQFRKAFEDGIGAEKAYGFGMLMVSRT